MFYGALYGPEDITRPQFEIVKSRFKHIKDVRFQLREDAPARSCTLPVFTLCGPRPDLRSTCRPARPRRSLRRCPYLPRARLAPMDSERRRGTSFAASCAGAPAERSSHVNRQLFFAPISGVSGSDARAQVDMCKKITNKHGFDYLGTFYIGQREMHHIVTILWDRSKPEQRIAADKCIRELIRSHAELGYGEVRLKLLSGSGVWSSLADLLFSRSTAHTSPRPTTSCRPTTGTTARSASFASSSKTRSTRTASCSPAARASGPRRTAGRDGRYGLAFFPSPQAPH